MAKFHARLSRRRFLASAAIGAAAAGTGTIARPAVLRAQSGAVKLGLLHPMTGALSYSGQQGRIGATMAVDEINAGGGIKALGGAKIDPILGDAQSTPDGGTAEVEKMNAAEVSCIIGGYASSICLAVSQAAARYELPYVVDVGVADFIVTRGLKNTFRFGPGFGVIANTALQNLTLINDQAGKPAKTVIIVNEDSLFGSGLAKLLNAQLPAKGFPDPRNHPASDADAGLQQCRAQDQGAGARSRHPSQLLQRVRTAGAHHAQSSTCGPKRFIRCSAALRHPTNSSASFQRPPSTSWIAIIGSIRRARRRLS